MKTFKNTAKISTVNSREVADGQIEFAEPLAITDDSRQWNNTRYDINSLDIASYDGTVTADHGQKIQDVIGKVTNLRKEGNKVLIDGIKFAVKENPLAVLAKNLMKGGFVTGVSIETIGEDPDDTLTWKNHALCGLSVVAHPNNKNAYAVISNSIVEANNLGLRTEAILNTLNDDEEIEIAVNEEEPEAPAEETFNSLMSNIHNRTDSILAKFGVVLNEGKGYNPYRNPDGTFASGPSSVGYDAFSEYSDTSDSSEKESDPKKKALGTINKTLDGMLRFGVNIERDVSYAKYGSSEFSKDVQWSAEQFGEFDHRMFGQEIQKIYKQVQPLQKKVSDAVSSGKPLPEAAINKLNSLSKRYNKEYSYHSKEAKDDPVNSKLYAKVYGYASAMANTLKAIGTE